MHDRSWLIPERIGAHRAKPCPIDAHLCEDATAEDAGTMQFMGYHVADNDIMVWLSLCFRNLDWAGLDVKGFLVSVVYIPRWGPFEPPHVLGKGVIDIGRGIAATF